MTTTDHDNDKERRQSLFSMLTSLRTRLRYIMQELRTEPDKNSSLHLCKVLYFIFFGVQAAYAPFVPLIISSVGATQVEIGLISAVRPFIGFVSNPLFGLAADKLGRHKLVLMALIAVSSFMRLGLLGSTSLFAVAAIVILSDFFASPVAPIIDSTVLDSLPDPLQYGKQRLWGTIGWGGCAPLAGLVISKVGTASALWVHAVGSILVLCIVARFRVQAPPSNGTIWSVWRVVFKDARTFVFFLGSIVMGQAYGAIGAFLFVRLQHIGGSALLMGLTLCVNCIVEAPMFHISEPVIRRLGLIGVLQLCLGLMGIRLAFYGLMENPWSVLLVEGIHGVTFALLWSAGTAYLRRTSPEGMGATMQGFYTGVKYGVGAGSGSLMAGALAHAYGHSFMFLCLAAYIFAAWGVVTLLRAGGLLDELAGGGGDGPADASRGSGLPQSQCTVRVESDSDAGGRRAGAGPGQELGLGPLPSRSDQLPAT